MRRKSIEGRIGESYRLVIGGWNLFTNCIEEPFPTSPCSVVSVLYLVVWVSCSPLPHDDYPGDHGCHQGHAGEGDGHVDGAAVLHLHAPDRVALESQKERFKVEWKKYVLGAWV